MVFPTNPGRDQTTKERSGSAGDSQINFYKEVVLIDWQQIAVNGLNRLTGPSRDRNEKDITSAPCSTSVGLMYLQGKDM